MTAHAFTALQLLAVAFCLGGFGIACFAVGESIRVKVKTPYVRWKMRAELQEATREKFSQLR